MSTNRRQFLILSGLAGLGLAGAGKLLSDSFSSDPVTAVPVPKSKLLLRFAVMADTGSGNMNQYAVGRSMAQYHEKHPFDTVLMAGDNIYTNGEFSKISSVFGLPYKDLRNRGVKFYATLGNHDVRSDKKKQDNTKENPQVTYPEFNMQGKRYYTRTQGDVRFYALETSSLVNPEDPDRKAQLAWLDRELAASKAKWNIVYGHHNVYSAGQYGINQVMVRDITPILKKHNVKLFINGHDHNYQRSKPIDGTTYMVCGGGGASLYPVTDQSWTAYAKSTHSFGIVEVYQDQIILTGIDKNGKILDRGLVTA
jgi:UDP-2,3-diacylglucosamine pyrophosphatase LpxH